MTSVLDEIAMTLLLPSSLHSMFFGVVSLSWIRIIYTFLAVKTYHFIQCANFWPAGGVVGYLWDVLHVAAPTKEPWGLGDIAPQFLWQIRATAPEALRVEKALRSAAARCGHAL